MKTLKNIDQLDETIRDQLEKYALKFIKLHDNNLDSLSVYGSAVGPDFIPGESDINLLAVLDKITLDTLNDSLRWVANARNEGFIAPLMLTLEHMQTSADVFPIEFLDMKDFHVVIHGESPFERLEIGRENLRLECEEQVKGKLIRLRQAYLEMGTRKTNLKQLFSDSISALIPVFRGILRLNNIEPALKKEEAINQLEELTEFTISSCIDAFKIKAGALELSKNELKKTFGRYISEMEQLATFVDKM